LNFALRISIFLTVNDNEVASAREITICHTILFRHFTKEAQWLVCFGIYPPPEEKVVV